MTDSFLGNIARELQKEGVSAAEWVALRLTFGEKKRTSGDLATLTGMTRSAVSKVVEKLESKELVSRKANPDDSRVQWLVLTKEGERLVPRLAAVADRNDAHFFDCLTKTEKAELRRVLEKLAEAHGLRDVPVD